LLQGKVNLDDPAVRFALLKLNAVIGVRMAGVTIGGDDD
jgi:hypothetical protein